MSELITLDINLEGSVNNKVAYYRIDSKFRDFIKLCQEHYKVVGFKWDGRSLNFGIICEDKQTV